MSDSSNILCVEGTFENNAVLAANVIHALQRKKIIQRDLTDCVLGGLGYAKGKKFSEAVNFPEDGKGLSLNGVKARLDPTAYYSGEVNPEFEIICPNCDQDWFRDISVADFYMEKLTRGQLQTYDDFVIPLYAYKGEGYKLRCPHCGKEDNMNSYDYKGQIIFSNLAFEFYNWGDLKKSFVLMIESNLGKSTKIYNRIY